MTQGILKAAAAMPLPGDSVHADHASGSHGGLKTLVRPHAFNRPIREFGAQTKTRVQTGLTRVGRFGRRLPIAGV